MTIVIQWPQAVFLTLYVLGMIAAAVLHGKPKGGNHNFWAQTASSALGFAILYAGGFFG